MDWKAVLEDVDDDYLIGLSNKGIVKRAYKDKGETAAEIGEAGQEAVVKVGTETVTVRFPLGESKCTCPSRSMCRHVVHAILVLQESCRKEGGSVRTREEQVSQGGSAEQTSENGPAEQASQGGPAEQTSENGSAEQVSQGGSAERT